MDYQPHGSVLDRGTEDETAAELAGFEKDKARMRAPMRAALVYEILRRSGDHELGRPKKSLIYSSVAAGIAISLSIVMEALLIQYLPDAHWSHVFTTMGYTAGFLFVILARQQLFTESTISAVLPVLAAPSLNNLSAVARLWVIVFLGNLAGTALFGLIWNFTPIGSAETAEAITALSLGILEPGFFGTLMRGIAAGFLIAGVVWLLPSSRGFEFFVIFFFTWLIALGRFAHVVAGSAEAWYLVFGGHAGFFYTFGTFVLPALIGNIIGGTLLLTMLSFGQVVAELHDAPEERGEPSASKSPTRGPTPRHVAAAEAGYELPPATRTKKSNRNKG